MGFQLAEASASTLWRLAGRALSPGEQGHWKSIENWLRDPNLDVFSMAQLFSARALVRPTGRKASESLAMKNMSYYSLIDLSRNKNAQTQRYCSPRSRLKVA